ncbi:molybdopterin-binding protein [Anaerotignum faecicola]|nr:molybdopterin-binding protein [Anaerotignum faecicola]
MFKNAFIIPTGDELKAGIVLDTDSPMIMQELLSLNGGARVTRLAPVEDIETAISETVLEMHKSGADLIVLIGGSGGGHRYSTTLGRDFTHSSLENILENSISREMYGKNGHMWSKLVIGNIGGTLVFNVPGPYDEAKAAVSAFKKAYAENETDFDAVNKRMMEAVKAKYGFE